MSTANNPTTVSHISSQSVKSQVGHSMSQSVNTVKSQVSHATKLYCTVGHSAP